MRIVQINTVCGKSGSVGRITADLYQYMKKNDIDGYVAFSRGVAFGIDEEKGIQIGKLGNNYLDGIKSRIFDNSGFNSKTITKQLVKKLEQLKPDIVHIHNLHGYYIHIGVLFDYLKRSDVKVVWTLHDCWSFTGHCCYFDFINCDKWKTGCYECLETKIYPKAFLDRSKKNYIQKQKIFTSLKRENLTIVTPSVWLKELVKQSFLKDYHVVTIENGIDVSQFSMRESTVKERYEVGNKKIILGVANKWDRRKGLDDFISLSQMLGSDYAFIVIGVDELQMNKLPPEIIGVSHTNSVEELVEFYNGADVYVNPTYEDNYPTTNMEAQACGCPVVTYKTGGSCENVIPEFGLSVEKGNLDALSKAVKRVTERYNDRKKLSEQADKFKKENTFEKYLQLYKKIFIK